MKLNLDPRTKLYMILVVSAVVMMSATTPLLWGIRIILTMIPVALLIVEKRYASALRFSVMYAIALSLMFFCLSAKSQGVIMALLLGYATIVAQFMPAMIMAWYVVRTTKTDEFISVMQKMHIPDGITISLAVVMRFFPTIKEENASIRDAMKMRGIMFGKGNLLKMVEYRMIPLMFSCVNIGDELSAAAITRGLGGKVKRTSVEQLKLNIQDYALIGVFTVCTMIFVFFKYIK